VNRKRFQHIIASIVPANPGLRGVGVVGGQRLTVYRLAD